MSKEIVQAAFGSQDGASAFDWYGKQRSRLADPWVYAFEDGDFHSVQLVETFGDH